MKLPSISGQLVQREQYLAIVTKHALYIQQLKFHDPSLAPPTNRTRMRTRGLACERSARMRSELSVDASSGTRLQATRRPMSNTNLRGPE